MSRRLFIQQLAAATTLGTRVLPELQAFQSLTSAQPAGEAAPPADSLFYRPLGGRVGDVIPFYADGRFRVFYLNKLDNSKLGTSWCQVSTQDFVHFTDHGEMLPRGTPDDQDLSVATGSVIQHQGRYHIFYTGYNSIFRKQGKPEQGVMHAVSDDLLRWTKVPADTFNAPQTHFERDDWRDPFVFWNPDAGEYWMLVAARLKSGPSRRRGCTALCVSKDLTKWDVREPFWSPGLYFTHECPDLFRMGDWWYFVFSEFSEGMQTRYRMSRNLNGPWHAPEEDTFDGRAFYAAKTASNGRSRFLLGWNPTRTNDKDYSHWQWGGNLVVHELVQQGDGQLSVKIPKSIDAAFSSRLPLQIQQALGKSEISGNGVTIAAAGSFGAATAGPMAPRCKIEATIEFREGTRGCGLILHCGDDMESGYYIRLEPAQNRLVFDKWPRPGDVPFMIELERAFALKPRKPVDLKVVVDGTIGEVYVGGQKAMSTRMYDLKQAQWGVFVNQGTAHFRDLAAFSMTG